MKKQSGLMKGVAIVAVTLGFGAFVAGAAEGDTKPRPAPAIPEWAKQYDKNGDGKLDGEERAAATKARREEMLKKYDKNGDGKLDPDEQKAMNEERRKEREEALAKRKADQEKNKEGKKEKKDDK